MISVQNTGGYNDLIFSEQLIDEQRLKDLEKKNLELEESLAIRQRELEESEAKHSKAFVDFQAKIAKFDEEKKRLIEEVGHASLSDLVESGG